MARIKLIPSLGFISQLFLLEECPLEFLSGPQESGPEREEEEGPWSQEWRLPSMDRSPKVPAKRPGGGRTEKASQEEMENPRFLWEAKG